MKTFSINNRYFGLKLDNKRSTHRVGWDLNRRGQNSKILQGALDRFVNGTILVGSVTLGGAQRLQFAQIRVEILLADFFLGISTTR